MPQETLRGLLSRAAVALKGPNAVPATEREELAEALLTCKSPDAHPLIGQSFPVLDQGFVKLVRFMGGDAEIVEAARLTAQSEGKDDGRNLLRFLMRHSHSTPIEFFEIVLHVRCPMDVWRQWIRHRTANVNEYSTRYTAAIDACQKTPPDQWRTQSTSNRQGSAGLLTEWPAGFSVEPVRDAAGGPDKYSVVAPGAAGRLPIGNLYDAPPTPGQYFSDREDLVHDVTRELYEERLAAGIAKEQARKDLPLSNYTEAYWKIDGGNLINFLRLRMDGHAQKEIRDYANVIGERILSQLCPHLWEAFNDYVFHAMKLTRLDQIVIQRLLTEVVPYMEAEAKAHRPFSYTAPYPVTFFEHCQYDDWKGIAKCRERDECLAKLQKLGLVQLP